MVFRPISQRRNEIRIAVEPVWPSFAPPLFFQNVQIAGFAATQVVALELFSPSNESVEKIFSGLYPNLNIVLVAELSERCREAGVTFDPIELVRHYGWRDSEDLKLTLHLIGALPREFRDWAASRELAVQDLAPLRALKPDDFAKIENWLTRLVGEKPSRSEGVRALEWLIDLYLAGTPITDFTGAGLWREHLYRLRYPAASARVQERAEIAKKLPWPRKTQVRALQNGDQAGFEVKLFVTSSTDLETQIRGLENVAREYARSSEPLP